MASITHDRKTGRRTIQFKDGDGSRKSLRLGKCDKNTATGIKTHVEHLVLAKGFGHPIPVSTAEWLTDISKDLRERLQATGLIKKPAEELKAEEQAAVVGLSEFIARYIDSRTDAKFRTIRKWNTSKRLLSEFLGAAADIASITAGDASRFKLHLMAMKKKDGSRFYSPSTLGKHIEAAKLFFTAAVDDGLRQDNPFAKVKGSKAVNEERVRFVPGTDVMKCIEATADPQWKLIIALSRFGGLRTPSEHVRLRWEDIDWCSNA